MWKYGFAKPEAGVFGDSFGFVNSLFSSFAFLIATYALIMQIQESHESGRIQEKQIDIQTTQLAIADRTASLLKDQTEIARATAQIQESIRRDVQRETAMTALLKIEQDAMRYRHALIEWKYNFSESHFIGPPIETADTELINRALKKEYHDALTELRSNLFRVTLIFGDDSESLKIMIREFCDVGEKLLERAVVKNESECANWATEQITRIEMQMMPLWDKIRA